MILWKLIGKWKINTNRAGQKEWFTLGFAERKKFVAAICIVALIHFTELNQRFFPTVVFGTTRYTAQIFYQV